MSHYSIEELIALWKKEELSVEQLIGQILQILRAQDQRLREVGKQRGSGAGAISNSDERNA
jgi:hypothetical protein